MFKKEKPKLIKFYGFPSPSDPNILYGSTDPKVAERNETMERCYDW